MRAALIALRDAWREKAAGQGAIYASGIWECADALDAVIRRLQEESVAPVRVRPAGLMTREEAEEVEEIRHVAELSFQERQRCPVGGRLFSDSDVRLLLMLLDRTLKAVAAPLKGDSSR
jgi:hypothetical protein